MSFAKKSLSLLTNRLGVIFAGMVLSIILARILGPTKLGIIAIIMIIPQYFEKFGRLGLGTSAMYRISRKELDPIDVANVLLTFSLVIGLIPALLFFVYNDIFVNTFLKNHTVATWYFIAVLVTLPANFVINFFEYIFLSTEDVATINRMRLISKTMPGIVSILLLVGTTLDIGAVIIGTASVNMLCAFYVINQFKKIHGRFPSLVFNLNYLGLLLSYGWKVYLRIIISFLHYRIDLIIIMYFLAAADVAFYKLAGSIVEKIWMLNFSAFLLIPRVASDNGVYGKDLTIKVFRNTLWIMGASALGLLFLSKWVIGLLYGDAFLPTVAPIKVLLPGIVMMGSGGCLSQYYIGTGHVGKTNYVFGLSIFLNIFLNILMIPSFGIIGAAIATSITYTASTVVIGVMFVNETDTKIKNLVILKKSDFAKYRELFFTLFQDVRGRIIPAKS